jgi:hypothetical protein
VVWFVVVHQSIFIHIHIRPIKRCRNLASLCLSTVSADLVSLVTVLLGMRASTYNTSKTYKTFSHRNGMDGRPTEIAKPFNHETERERADGSSTPLHTYSPVLGVGPTVRKNQRRFPDFLFNREKDE